jgi:hypothetical protein
VSAAMALANFVEICNGDILTPYLDNIVTKLILLLKVFFCINLHLLFFCLLI